VSGHLHLYAQERASNALSASKREASASAAGLGWCEQMSTYTSMHICTPNVSYIARITHICRTTRTKKLGYSPEESIRVYRRPTGCLNIWYCAHSIVVCEPMRTICLVSRRLRRTTTSSEGFALSDGALNPISASHQCISSHCTSECRAVGVSCIESKYACHIIAYHGRRGLYTASPPGHSPRVHWLNQYRRVALDRSSF